jgi:aryl-alcohol dehydrogenase-like predicted oxidoreductase
MTEKRTLGPFKVESIGLGCMNLDHAYGPASSAEQGRSVFLGALDAGYDFFDTATLYGGGNNETRVGEVLGPIRRSHPDAFVLASKCGMAIVPQADGSKKRIIDGRPDTLKRECDASLKRLQTEVIDLYYLHRWDKSVPIEESMGALADLKRAGKIRSIGLSEVSAATLKRAHAVHPVAAVQSEYSLWTREPEIAILEACRELGVAFVAFSPVARAYLCGLNDPQSLPANDIRRGMGRFSAEHFPHNLAQQKRYLDFAASLNLSGAQLANAWVISRGSHVISIPGTTRLEHAVENFSARDITLTPQVIAKLEEIMHTRLVRGGRYDPQSQSEVDTEQFV